MIYVISNLSLLIFLLQILLCETAFAAKEFDPVSSGLRMLWGLLVVLAIMFVLYYFMKKRLSAYQQHGKGTINIVEIKNIPPRKSLMLVEVRGREFLVGGGNDSINTIVPLQGSGAFSAILEKSEEKLQP